MDEVKKEMKIRRRIMDIFNKELQDFSSKDEFDEYLEGVEDIIYNLSFGVDVEATERKVLQYQREYADIILQNQARKADEARRKNAAAAAARVQAADAEAAADETENASTSATLQVKPDPELVYNPAAAMSAAVNVQPVALQEVKLDRDGFIIGPPGGPGRPTPTQQRAGGWSADISRKRHMEEAFSQLFVF